METDNSPARTLACRKPCPDRHPPIVIFACGNPSRGDDALGPLLLDRLQTWLGQREGAADFELIGDFQLQIEHALDLCGRRLVLFIDAGERTPAPFVFHEISADATVAPVSHALSPSAVLAVALAIHGQSPPPAFSLCVRGECFVLGEDLSAPAEHFAEQAFTLLTRLCRRPRLAFWRQYAASVNGCSTVRQQER